MAIPSNGFEVIFLQKNGETIIARKVEEFFTSEHEFYEQREIVFFEIKENIDIAIIFRATNLNTRLYMDGLDTLSHHLIEVDPLTAEVYLTPSTLPVTLYSNTQNYYPLIPGFYRIVVEQDGKRYYSWLKVIPKQLEESQWEMMRDEIENQLKGLAKDIVLKRTGFNSRIEGMTPARLAQFVVIQSRFSSVMAAISDLYRKVNYRICKEYSLIPWNKSRMMDERTVRHRVSHPEHEDVLMSPIANVTYDLPENRLVKKIILSVSKTLSDFIDSVESMKRNIQSGTVIGVFRSEAEKRKTLFELEKLVEMAGKMRGAIQWITSSPWFDSVSVAQTTVVPHVMNSDPRYRAIYQLYRELRDEKIQFVLDKSYSYQWKRTDKLYEIWGFIQFIKVLSGPELNFVPEKGWAFSEAFDGSRLLVPTLPPNTEVVFRKNDLRVNLVYEALLPTQSKLTSRHNPLYTRGTHTCPDGRIDVYKNEIFIGSIIFDFKYRPKSAIWDQSLIQMNKQNEVMRQLVSYGDNLHSPFLFGADSGISLFKDVSPIQEVWAIYPNRFGMTGTIDFPDHKLSLFALTPGAENTDLAEKIKTAITQLLQRADPIMTFLGS